MLLMLSVMGGLTLQMYILLWKDVCINRIRRHCFRTLLVLVFLSITLYGIWSNTLETKFGDPVPPLVFPRVHPLQLWPRTATKLVYTPNVPLLNKVRAHDGYSH